MKLTYRKARERRALMQVEAAALLEISNVHLCNVEGGKSNPSLRLVRKMARLYRVSIASLL